MRRNAFHNKRGHGKGSWFLAVTLTEGRQQKKKKGLPGALSLDLFFPLFGKMVNPKNGDRAVYYNAIDDATALHQLSITPAKPPPSAAAPSLSTVPRPDIAALRSTAQHCRST